MRSYTVVYLLLSVLASSVETSSNSTCRNVVYNIQKVESMHQVCESSQVQSKLIEDLLKQVASLQSDVQTLKTEVDSLKAASKQPSIVGFHVALSKPQTSPGTMQFDAIIHHYGNCWNSSTKMFVAPTTGLYAFHFTLFGDGSVLWNQAQIMYENQRLQKAHGQGANNAYTATAVVKVNKGEHVYVRHMNGGAYSNDQYWTNFVGYLIQKF